MDETGSFLTIFGHSVNPPKNAYRNSLEILLKCLQGNFFGIFSEDILEGNLDGISRRIVVVEEFWRNSWITVESSIQGEILVKVLEKNTDEIVESIIRETSQIFFENSW